jgi:hypothetical protein
MKIIRITASKDYLVPDDCRIIDHPEEGHQCIQADGSFWSTELNWMRFHPHAQPLYASTQSGTGRWIEDDNGPANFELETSGETYERIPPPSGDWAATNC